MKVLGYDFTFNGVHKIEAQEAPRPSRVEIGESGTNIIQGIINEEYNPKLDGVTGIRKYDEMRKSDGTVRAAVLATQLPIRRAKWYVKPASEDERDVEIADLVSAALFDYLNHQSFDDVLRQALLSLPFGVMLFEKVFTVRSVNGQERVVWEKFAPRLPKTIQAWATAENQPGVQQLKQNGDIVSIPAEKLVIIVNEMEGENWWGNSILRPAYKHWFIKNTFYKIDAMAFERQGLGVPFGKLPENYTEEDRSNMEKILKNMRAHEQSYIIEPHDHEIGFKDMGANSTRDPEPSIAHHNREIVKCVLAQFLELGAGPSGSRALSEDQSSLFLGALEAVANNVAETISKEAVKQLVDLNYENVDFYPTLEFDGISRKDVKNIADAYKVLVDAGGVAAQEADERYFRGLLDLPEVDDTDAEETEENNEDGDEILEDLGLSEYSKRKKKKKKNYATQS